MKYFKFYISTAEQEILGKIISGILPHENMDEKLCADVIKGMFSAVHMDELYGIEYLFFKIIKNMNSIRIIRKGFAAIIKSELFEASLQANLLDIIVRPEFNAKMFFQLYGKEFDLTNQAELQKAGDFLYTEAMDRYNELFEMKTPTAESLANISILKDRMKTSAYETAISIAAQIVTSGYQAEDGVLQGIEDSIKFTTSSMQEIIRRFGRDSEEMAARFIPASFSNYEQSREFDSEHARDLKPLYFMGFEPFDNIFAIAVSDIITIIADEGTGKTRLVVDQSYKAIQAHNNVIIYCGETQVEKYKKLLEARHLFEMYNIQCSFKELMNPNIIPHESLDELEDIILKINASCADLYDNDRYGTVTYVQSLCYEDALDSIRDSVEENNAQMVFIDHVSAMDNNGAWMTQGRLDSKQKNVSYLYHVEDILTKELNVAFFNVAHTNTDAARDLYKGKAVQVRSGAESSATTKYSSMVFLLRTTDDLANQDMVILQCTKMRDEKKPPFPIVLNRLGYSNLHVYDEGRQYLISGVDAQDITDKDPSVLLEDS